MKVCHPRDIVGILLKIKDACFDSIFVIDPAGQVSCLYLNGCSADGQQHLFWFQNLEKIKWVRYHVCTALSILLKVSNTCISSKSLYFNDNGFSGLTTLVLVPKTFVIQRQWGLRVSNIYSGSKNLCNLATRVLRVSDTCFGRAYATFILVWKASWIQTQEFQLSCLQKSLLILLPGCGPWT